VLASTAPGGLGEGISLSSLLSDSRDSPTFLVLSDRTYQFFFAPVRTPETIAWVAMGFVVDDAFARKIHDVIGADVTLVANGRGGPVRIGSTQPSRTQDYLTFRQRIESRGDSLDMILQRPMHEVLAPYRELRNSMLLIDGVALALAAAIGALLGRSATRPIGELVRAAERIREGRYDTAVTASGGAEFRSLAVTFNTMQQNIARREADITLISSPA
jgi:HAMP domain-containing protein